MSERPVFVHKEVDERSRERRYEPGRGKVVNVGVCRDVKDDLADDQRDAGDREELQSFDERVPPRAGTSKGG